MTKKLYYKIGEACRMLEVQPYVLRYWETEFPFLSPSKSRSGQRVYNERELEIIRRIKELLYEDGYTIAGAKKKIEAELNAGGSKSNGSSPKARPEGESESPASEVDSAASEEIERLRQGLEGAVTEARKILRLLESRLS